jgi:hypothetical protein
MTIQRTVGLTQPTALPSQGRFFPRTHETAFDRQMMAAQQVDRRVADAEVTHAVDKAAQAVRDTAQDSRFEGLALGIPGDPSALTVTSTGSTTSRSLAARFVDVAHVKDFGAVGDGVVDDKLSIQAAIMAGAGKRVVFGLPSARYYVTGALSVPSNTEIEGVGPGLIEIQVPAGSTFRVFDVDGKSNVKIRGFKITKAAGAATGGDAAGVSIRGASTDVVVEEMSVDGFVDGISIAGEEGTAPGIARRVTLRNVTAKNSPTNYGIVIDDADGVLVDNCYGTGNWLDGGKLRRNTKNVTVRGGYYNSNGVSGAGDGWDAYGGGDGPIFDGVTAEDNSANGITFKTGDVNQNDPGTYGYVRGAQFIGLRLRRNLNIGLYITVSDQADLAEPLVTNTTVMGGMFEENAQYNIYLGGRNITLIAPAVRAAGQHGIALSARSMDIEIIAPRVIANGTDAPGSYDGISVAGTRIRLRGGIFQGKDATTIAVDGDFAALTAVSRYAVLVSSLASDVEIDAGDARGFTVVDQLAFRTSMTSGRCIIRQSGASTPVSAGAYGSIGSTWTRTDVTGAPVDVLWVKTSGTPDDPNVGWQRTIDIGGILLRGDVDYAASGASDRTLIWTSALTTTRTVTLPTTALYEGMRFRVVRYAGATGADPLNVSDGSTTVKALTAAGQWVDVEYSGSDWLVTAAGTL